MKSKHDKKTNKKLIKTCFLILYIVAPIVVSVGVYFIKKDYTKVVLLGMILFEILIYLTRRYFSENKIEINWCKFRKRKVYMDKAENLFKSFLLERNIYYILLRLIVCLTPLFIWLLMKIVPMKIVPNAESGNTNTPLIVNLISTYVFIFIVILIVKVMMNKNKSLFQFGVFNVLFKIAIAGVIINVLFYFVILISIDEFRNIIYDRIIHLQNKTSLIISALLGITALFISYFSFVNRGDSRLRWLPYPQIDITMAKEDEKAESIYNFSLPADSLKPVFLMKNAEEKEYVLKLKITNKSITPISQLRLVARSNDYERNPYVTIKQGDDLYCSLTFKLKVNEKVIYRIPLEIYYKTVSSKLTYKERVVLHFNPENIAETGTIMQKTSASLMFIFNDFLDPCLKEEFPKK